MVYTLLLVRITKRSIVDLRIDEERAKFFPVLAASLEKYGQLQPILIDSRGIIHDGHKRVYLCGLERLEKTLVPDESLCSNIYANKEQKKVLVREFYNSVKRSYGSKTAEYLAERYKVSRATIFNWVQETPDSTTQKMPGASIKSNHECVAKLVFPWMDEDDVKSCSVNFRLFLEKIRGHYEAQETKVVMVNDIDQAIDFLLEAKLTSTQAEKLRIILKGED